MSRQENIFKKQVETSKNENKNNWAEKPQWSSLRVIAKREFLKWKNDPECSVERHRCDIWEKS